MKPIILPPKVCQYLIIIIFFRRIENLPACAGIDPKTCPSAIRDCPLRGLFSFLGFLSLQKCG